MDTLTASSIYSRPWVPQFFRNLFGSNRHVRQEEQGSKADTKEKEGVKRGLLDSPVPDTEARLSFKNTEPDKTEICEEMMDSHTEKLSGYLEEMRLGDTIPIAEKRLSTLLGSTRLEMGDSDGFIKRTLVPDPNEKVSASGEKKAVRGTVEIDGLSQVLCADDGVSTMARSLAVGDDSSAEEEREHLLKEDVTAEPPKAELSPWNRFINMYKQRWRVPASKVSRLQAAQPETEDEASLDLMVHELSTPKSHVTLSTPPGTICVYGLPENNSGHLSDHCETAQGGSRSNNAGSTLECPKNMF